MDSETDFRTRFVRMICENSWIWAILFGFSLVVLVVLLLLLPALQPGSRNYYITLVTIGLSSVLVVAYGVTVYRCRQYHQKKRQL
jgi:bacteriorhodopsin